MRVLIVEPLPPRTEWPRGIFRSRWVPMGPAYMGRALLRAGHQVRIHCSEEQVIKASGARQAGDPGEAAGARDVADAALRRDMEEFRPDMVGLSLTTPAVPTGEEVARMAKELSGGRTLVVVGGPHPRRCPSVP